MENKEEKRIDIRKIISIILFINIISALFVISCFASTTTILDNTYYDYNYSTVSINSSQEVALLHGSYKGEARHLRENVTNYYEFNFESLQLYNSGEVYLMVNGTSDYYLIGKNGLTFSGIILFTDYSSVTVPVEINTYLLNNLSYNEEENMIKNMYVESGNFLSFSVNTVKSIINYMITNNVILIVIAIVMVSFAIGALIRLNRKKF